MNYAGQDQFDIFDYDKYILGFSGGKDSIADFLHLLELGIPKEKIELWHHDIDGGGKSFMDWKITMDYCRKFAEAFGVTIQMSYKQGGFEREMLRENSLTAPTIFETPNDGWKQVGGTRGKPSTRRKFPQVSANLSVRWCSAYLKIDVMAAAIRNQERFNNSRTLVITGERGEESSARAKYNIFEVDRSDNRNGKNKRHVDHWRPIRDWKEQEVWAIMERWKVRAHPAYFLGWGRVSCLFCIFGNKNQFKSAYVVAPKSGDKVIAYETEFGVTIKRKGTIKDLIDSGIAYDAVTHDAAMVALSQSHEYTLSIFMEEWELPCGAYGENDGPI